MSYFCKNVHIGDAGIPRDKKEEYKKTLCFLVEGDKFVDVHMTKSQLKRLQRILKDELEALEEDEYHEKIYI